MIMRIVQLCAAVLASIAFLTPGSAAEAHPMPHTNVILDVTDQHIGAEFRLPLDDLALASGIDLRQHDPLQAVDPARRQQLADYLRAHTNLTSDDGREWTVEIGQVRMADASDPEAGPYREVVLDTIWVPPSNADVRQFTIVYGAIIDDVVTHEALVSVRQDFGAGRVDRDKSSRLLGTVRIDSATMTVPPLRVNLNRASQWAGFTAMFTLGADHIFAGTDHLLFVLSLLILAPLVMAGGRWQRHNSFRRALRRTGAITLAFTVGHSVALGISALTRVDVPERIIEVLIAATIFVTGVHAMKPMFPGREVVVAAGFGLIHGMAFSMALSDLALSGGQLALSLIGFNLGIEAAQVLLIALALPPLLLVTATRFHAAIRLTFAATVTVAATGWALDRAGMGNPIAFAADQLTTIRLPGIVLFAAVVTAPSALLLWWHSRRTAETASERVLDGAEP